MSESQHEPSTDDLFAELLAETGAEARAADPKYELGRVKMKTTKTQVNVAYVREWQQRLLAREFTFAELVERESLQLGTDRLGYFSHWVTPLGIPRRYDTRFLVAAMPSGQPVQVDGREAVSHDWLRPSAALAANTRGELRLIFPTIRNLEALAAFATAAGLLAHAQSVRPVPATLPKIVGQKADGKDASGLRLLVPGDPGYDEA